MFTCVPHQTDLTVGGMAEKFVQGNMFMVVC